VTPVKLDGETAESSGVVMRTPVVASACGNWAEPINPRSGGHPVVRRFVGVAVAGAALLAAFGCGGGGNDASVGSGAVRHKVVAPAADGDSSSGLQTVTYRGVQFDVPADWPVHDLAADPTTCVRFDVHAVYLGAPGADMSCPAGIIGRADAVLVQPTASDTDASTAGDVSTATASGLAVQVATDSATTHEVDAAVPSAGVSVTLSYQDSDATAQQILQSFRAAS
jgi:hypothetical protein